MDKVDPKRTATYRAALAAVIILSVLLVLALVGVVAGFVRQARLYQADHAASAAAVSIPAASVSTAAMPAAAEMVLAPGAHILSAATDSGKLVLHVRTRAGNEVDIFDLASGKLSTRIKDGPQ